MSNTSFQNIIKKITKVTFVVFVFSSVTAVSFAKSALADLQKEARSYRAQGLEQQAIGNLEGAMSLYQKAVELDPSYAVAYNDLGVIYEAMGDPARAEESYQKALTVDPNYLSTYSNLALFYENKNDVDKASIYWKKRAQLGSLKDPWAQKAKDRLTTLMKMSPAYKQRLIEQQVEELAKKVAEQKRFKKQQDLNRAKEHVNSAKKLYNNADYLKAIAELNLALSLNPQEKEASGLLETIKAKMAEQEKKAREEKKKQNLKNMQAHFESGIRYYQQDNLQAAKEEFAKITEFNVSPQ